MPPVAKRPAILQKPLHIASWLAFPVITIISYFRAISTGRRARVRALILHNNHVLLVRNNGDHINWTLPGGGVNEMEAPSIALQRELTEELGLQGNDDYFTALESLITLRAKDIHEFSDRTIYKVDFLTGFLNTAIKPNIELLDAAWFPLQKLPKKTAKLVYLALKS